MVYIKVKIVHSKRTANRMKRQYTKWEKNYQTLLKHWANIEYKHILSILFPSNIKYAIEIWAIKMNRHFIELKIPMTINILKSSTTLIIREMQLEIYWDSFLLQENGHSQYSTIHNGTVL